MRYPLVFQPGGIILQGFLHLVRRAEDKNTPKFKKTVLEVYGLRASIRYRGGVPLA